MALVKVNRSWYIRGFSLADPPLGSYYNALNWNSWTVGVHDHGAPGVPPVFNPNQLVDDTVYSLRQDLPESVIVKSPTEAPAIAKGLPEGTDRMFLEEVGLEPAAWLELFHAKKNPFIPEGATEEQIALIAQALVKQPVIPPTTPTPTKGTDKPN